MTRDELEDCYKLYYFLLITNETGQPPRSREQAVDPTVTSENLERRCGD